MRVHFFLYPKYYLGAEQDLKEVVILDANDDKIAQGTSIIDEFVKEKYVDYVDINYRVIDSDIQHNYSTKYDPIIEVDKSLRMYLSAIMWECE
jgi:hypothetical protein